MTRGRWRILLADDDTVIRRSLASQLLHDDFEIISAASGREALEQIASSWPDLAVLDLMMPGMTGFELADRLRRYIDIPIIMLTSINDEATTVEGLEQHADDYMTKPFRYAELRARINRLLHKTYAGRLHPGETVLVDDHMTIDLGQHTVQRGSEIIALEPIETRILYLLLQTPTQPVATSTLLRKAWGFGEEGDPSSLWVRIRSLRRKLEANPSQPVYLQTVRGIGYMWSQAPRRGL